MTIARRIVLLATLACLPALAADEEINVTPAINAATAWLALIDGQRYGESWDQSSQIFQDAMPRLKWETTAQSVRGPLGPVNGRKMHSANYTRALPGAPAGEYVVIRFETHFVNRPFSTETVMPSREKDGSWKVSGYLIQ